MVADDLRDLEHGQVRVQQVFRRAGHADLFQQIGKADTGVLPDQRTQMRFGIMKLIGKLRQRDGLIMMPDGLQDMGEIRTGLVTIELRRVPGGAEHGRKEHVHMTDAAAVGVYIIPKALKKRITNTIADILFVSGPEQEIVWRLIRLEMVSEKQGERIIPAQKGEKGGLKGAPPQHEAIDAAVVRNLHIVHGARSDEYDRAL